MGRTPVASYSSEAVGCITVSVEQDITRPHSVSTLLCCPPQYVFSAEVCVKGTYAANSKVLVVFMRSKGRCTTLCCSCKLLHPLHLEAVFMLGLISVHG